MPLMIIFVLTLAGVLLQRLTLLRSGRTLLGLAAVLFLGGASGLLPQLLLHDLQWAYTSQMPDSWSQNNVIIVLGGGTTALSDGTVESELMAKGRIEKAAWLYAECKSAQRRCTVLVSGGDPQGHGISEAAVYKSDLQKLGVSGADIVQEDRSLNTWQNARYSAAIVRQYFAEPSTTLKLVTSAYHMHRSLLFFRHFGMHPTPVRADYLDRKPITLNAYNFLLTDVALHEYAGLLQYSLYESMGWNNTAPGTPPSELKQ